MSEQSEIPQQPQEQKDTRVPAENPSYKAFMEKRDATITAQEAESAPQIIEVSPTETAPKVSRERTPEAELTTNQERIKNNLDSNIDLFLEGKADAVDFSQSGAMIPSEKGKVVADNISRLIKREASGNLGDVETAAKRLRRDYNKQIRDAETPIRQEVKKTLKAAGAAYDTKMVDKAAKGLSSIQTNEIRAKMTMLDAVVKKERADARKAAAETRKIAVKDIASKLTSDEIDVFKRDLAREGKKVPASSALLKNMLAQKINAGYSIDPIAIKSVKMDELMREAQIKQAETTPSQSQTEPVASTVTPAQANQAEGFIPGLSAADTEELQRQNSMTPDAREAYKANAVAQAEQQASGSSPEPQEQTALDLARKEIQRIQNGELMRDDLPEEVRNHVIEQMHSNQETGSDPQAQISPERQQETPGQAIKAVVIDFEQRKQELMEKQDRSKFGKLKSWGRKAAAAAIIVGAVLGATRADGNNDSFADHAPSTSHTLTVDATPPPLDSPFRIADREGQSKQDQKESKIEIVTAQVQEGEGLTQVLKRVNGSFDTENPADWEKVGDMLKLNEDTLRERNPELYSKIDQAKQQQMAATGSDALSGEKIKELIHEGGENYPVLTFTGQELQTPSLSQQTT
ncbi:MAG: hypothetical protein E6P95_00020 [Candidatus Moraniibacteriota bacterium]|nr:MAG: hypothetical protein E6P95_00020 [Candidatus Moranbacteria bacterium]